MLSIMRACKEAGTVKRVVFTSSVGTINIEERPRPAYDQDNWSNIDFCRRVKMTGWVRLLLTHLLLLVDMTCATSEMIRPGFGGAQMYFVSKSLAEKAAMDYARENDVDFISIIPTLVVGPFLSAGMPPSLVTTLALVTGNEAHYSILKQVQLVHLDELCNSMTYLFEHPDANGRHICSSHDTTIHGLARMLRERFPEYDIPEKFAGIDDDLEPIHFSSKKLLDHVFRFRYTAEDMFDAAVWTYREKGLILLGVKGAGGQASAASKLGAVLVGEGRAIVRERWRQLGVGLELG
ncbi:hypothetical protein ACQ4PT_018507 [Festuca glaucescens]